MRDYEIMKGGGLAEKDCPTRAGVALVFGGLFGGVYGLVSSAWLTHSGGGITMPKIMGNIQSRAAVLALTGLAYTVTQCSAAGFGGGNSPQASALGGVAAGAVLGVAAGSVATGTQAAIAIGLTMGTIEFMGGKNPITQKTEKMWKQAFDYGVPEAAHGDH